MYFRKLIGEYGRYQLAGMIVAIAEAAALFFLTELLSIPYFTSNLLCFLLTTLLNYLFSVFFVFHPEIKQRKIQELAEWLGLSVLRLCVCQLILWAATEGLGLYYMVSKVLSMVFSHFYNFIVQRKLLQRDCS